MMKLKPTTLALTLGLLVTPVAFSLPAPTVALTPALASLSLDDDDDLPDKREVVKDLIDQWEDHIKAKGEEDGQAIAVLDKLNMEFANSGPKDRASIVKAVEKGLTLKRKDNEDGTPEVKVGIACAVVMGGMGPESVKPLISIATGKKLRKSEQLHRQSILALGKTKHEDAVKPLLGLIADKEAYIQGAAIEGLGEFREQEQDVRKEIVSDLIKNIMPLKNAVDNDSSDILARERFDVIGPPTITTLQNLTDQNLRDFNEWQSWWNNNKREDWDHK